MKLYYEKRTIFTAIFLLSIGLTLASIYFYGIMPQIRGMREGIELKAKVVYTEFRSSFLGSYIYPPIVAYDNPTSKLIERKPLIGHKENMEVGDEIEIYYFPEDGSIIYKNMQFVNSVLLYTLAFLVPGVWIIIKIIRIKAKINFLKKNGKKIKAKVTEFRIKSNTLFCEFTEGKTLNFVRENVNLKKCKNGLSVGDVVNVYIDEDNVSNYYIALEEL